MSKQLSALDKLKAQIKVSYQSTFDFGSYEIEQAVIEKVTQKEEIIFQEYKKYSNSIYEVCRALYEVSLELKQDGSFMSWYNHIGLNKDKVSELLKRYQLFMILPDKKEWIASLSNQAVKILTGVNVELQQLKEACFLEIKSVEDIKYWLTSANLISPKDDPNVPQVIEAIDDDIITEFKELRHKIKTLKNSDNLKQYKSQLKSVRRELEELEAIIQEQEEDAALKNNLNLFEDDL